MSYPFNPCPKMKNYTYYLLSVFALSASGWYNGVYRAALENEVYDRANYDIEVTHKYLSRYNENNLRYVLNNAIRVNGDSLHYIKTLAAQIDTIFLQHTAAMQQIDSVQGRDYNPNMQESDCVTYLYKKLTLQETLKMRVAHDSFVQRLQHLCGTYWGEKADLHLRTDSTYERHFAQASLNLHTLLPTDQHLWLGLEQEYALGLTLNMKQALCDFMNPKREKVCVNKIVGNCYTQQKQYKINQQFEFYFNTIRAIKSVAHTKITYWANDKKLPIKDGVGDLGNRRKGDYVGIELCLEDTLLKTKRYNHN